MSDARGRRDETTGRKTGSKKADVQNVSALPSPSLLHAVSVRPASEPTRELHEPKPVIGRDAPHTGNSLCQRDREREEEGGRTRDLNLAL